SDKHQGSGVPGRFSGSKDASANAGLLRISRLQAEAEVDCHWATAHSSGSSHRSSQRLREGGTPGSPPRDLLYYSSDLDKHEVLGVPGRFSGSKDASANAGLLSISGLQAEAEADSHWVTAHGSGSSYRSSQRLREGGRSWAPSVLSQPPSVSGALGQRVTISCTGSSLSHPVLNRPPSLSASPGTTARLTCTLSRDISVGSSNIDWIQQQPENTPQDLLYYSSDSDKHQGSRVPSRFSGSKDASANAGLLRISGLQAEAEADCHWATAHSSGSSHRPSQRLREGGSETKSPGPTDLVSESLASVEASVGECPLWGDLSLRRKDRHTDYAVA
uniref:uncharacterized protein LOC101380470 n=1 Tax=Odobenus rosmarus divergens TaxID=9708 RepID=UPI00063C19C9